MHTHPSWLVTLIKSVSKFPISFLQGIADKLCRALIFLSTAKTLKTARLNLAIALPSCNTETNRYLCKQSAINEMKSYFEFFKIWGSSAQDNIARIHNIQGAQHLHQALAANQGVILVVPHFGTWEVMNAWVSQYTAMTIMYKPLKHQAIDHFVRAARSRENTHLVPTDETGVKQIFKALKQGGTTVILPDHSPDFEGDLTPWFDVPLYSSHLVAKLVQKTKASALLLYAIRNDQGGFDMTIDTISPQIQDRTVNGTAIIHEAIESLIRQYPEHYHWSYKRFKANQQLRDVYDLPHDQALCKIRSIQHQCPTPALGP
jgi:KDO2-lipid IV(A) lauroyltransferase